MGDEAYVAKHPKAVDFHDKDLPWWNAETKEEFGEKAKAKYSKNFDYSIGCKNIKCAWRAWNNMADEYFSLRVENTEGSATQQTGTGRGKLSPIEKTTIERKKPCDRRWADTILHNKYGQLNGRVHMYAKHIVLLVSICWPILMQ